MVTAAASHLQGDISSHPWVAQTVREGYKIPLVSPPPLADQPLSLPTYPLSSERFRVLQESVRGMLYRDGSFDSCILQPSLCGSKSHRGLETSDRSKCTKYVLEMPILQDGDAKIHPDLSVQESMDGIHRSQGRLFSCPNPLPIKTIPAVLSSGQGLAVQGSSLRVVNQPKCVYEDPTTCLGSCSPQRRELTHVPRRLADQSKIEPVRCASETVAPVPLSRLDLIVPSQKMTYLWMSLDTRENLARPSDKRVLKWLSIAKIFLAHQVPPAGLYGYKLWVTWSPWRSWCYSADQGYVHFSGNSYSIGVN